MTLAEDGYLTLRFRTVWGGSQKHFVNLLLGQNPDNPYEVEFRHNAYGDTYGKRMMAWLPLSWMNCLIRRVKLLS